MNVLLLKPCWPYPIGQEESTYNRIWPPISLAYSASLLRQRGIAVQILDAHALRLKGNALLKQLAGFDRIFVTSSDLDRWLCPNLDLTPVQEAVSLAGSLCSEVYLVGQHGTVNPEGMRKITGARTVITGEPEWAIRDVCLAPDPRSLPPVYSSEKLSPLDDLPMPAWDLLPLERYHYELMGRQFMLIETARGCPFECTFCAKEVMYGPGVRRRSLNRVIQELDTAVRQHGIRNVYFYDLEFLINHGRVEQLCLELIRRNYPLKWCCQTRVTDAEPKILNLMKQAGCRLIHYGVESGSERVLERIKKRVLPEEARRAIAMTRQAGIESLCFFMLGLPGESRPDYEQTVRFARELNPTYASFHVASPHELIQPALAPSQRMLALPAKDQSFDPKMKRLIRLAFLRFYLNPRRLGENLRRLFPGNWRLLAWQLRLFLGYLRPSWNRL